MPLAISDKVRRQDNQQCNGELPYRRITVSDVLLLIGFASYYMPERYAVSNRVLMAWRIIVCIVSVVSLFCFAVRAKITLRWTLINASLWLYYLVSTIVNQSDGRMDLGLFYVVCVGGFVTLWEYVLATDFERGLRAFLIASIIMCSVHYATFLIYRDIPGGMRGIYAGAAREALERGTWFFFKHDNGSAFYFLPALTGLWYYVYSYGRMKRTTVLFSVLTLYMYWYQWSVAAMVVFTAGIGCYILISLEDKFGFLRWLRYRRALFLGTTICGLVVVLVCGGFEIPALVGTLSKSASLAARDRIWTYALRYIGESPIFGVGFEQDSTSILKMGYNHCHNMFLQLLYTGGIASLALMMMGLLRFGTKASKQFTKAQNVASISILLFFILASFDWYLYIPIPFTLFYLNSAEIPIHE